jgi:hypothetical protein
MKAAEVIEQIKALPKAEKLLVFEALANSLRSELEPVAVRYPVTDLAAAAMALREDYASDPELTAFTALDGEEFHAPR